MTVDPAGLLVSGLAMAAEAGAGGAGATGGAAPSGGLFLVQFAPFILIFVIFYFLLIAPQRKQQKEHEKMLASLKKGDRVWTSGGILGTIADFREAEKAVVLEIAANTRITIARSHIATLRKEATPPPAPASGT